MLSTPIPHDLCPVHREIAYAYRDHHYRPWSPSEWPGGSHIMDSRTSHAERAADWDRKNLEQIELTIECCRSGHSPQCTPGHRSPAPEESAHVPAPGAERWDLRLARTVLAGSNLPAHAPNRPGAGYQLAADGPQVRVTWGRRGSASLPRAGSAARAQWDEALERIEALLAGSAAFTEVRRTRHQVAARAVVPRTAQSTARMRRVGALDTFRRAVRFDGYPPDQVGGTLTLATGGATPVSFWIVADAEGAEAGRVGGGYQAAAELLANHYGLPMPLALVDEGRVR